MPELPDLLYIQKHLARVLTGRSIAAVEVKQPVLVRNMLDVPLGEALRVTRLALGLPVGAALEFADDVTLSRSLAGRREM